MPQKKKPAPPEKIIKKEKSRIFKDKKASKSLKSLRNIIDNKEVDIEVRKESSRLLGFLISTDKVLYPNSVTAESYVNCELLYGSNGSVSYQ